MLTRCGILRLSPSQAERANKTMATFGNLRNPLVHGRERLDLKVTEVGALSEPEIAAHLVEAFGVSNPQHLARVRQDVERHPSRVLANALVNSAWRNGPVENIHAGGFRGYPLDQRRVTLAEEVRNRFEPSRIAPMRVWRSAWRQ